MTGGFSILNKPMPARESKKSLNRLHDLTRIPEHKQRNRSFVGVDKADNTKNESQPMTMEDKNYIKSD